MYSSFIQICKPYVGPARYRGPSFFNVEGVVYDVFD